MTRSPQLSSASPFRLCAIDIDDTLIGHDRQISPENRRAISELQARGCEVALASGRRHANMVPFAESLGLGGFLVSCQGARVQHRLTGEVLHRAEITADVATSLAAEGLRRGFTVFLWLEDRIFANAHTRWVDTYRTESGGDEVTVGDLRAFEQRSAEKVVWSGSPVDVAHAARDVRAELPPGVDGMITNDWYFEFTALDATKAAGVAAIARHLGVPREAVLAFGDGNNDVPLLSWAGLGIAMPHGRQSAKDAAARVGPPGNPESALARALDEVLQQS